MPRRANAHENGAARAKALRGAPASARALVVALDHLREGALRVSLPNGEDLHFGDGQGPSARLIVKDYAFAPRVLRSGDIGFAEGFMAGDWDSPDLSTLLTLLAGNTERIKRYFVGSIVGRVAHWAYHMSRDNSREGSRRNILEHYDLGNRFYETWLDESMTYSSGMFQGAGNDVSAAQQAKYRALAERLELKAGEHVLEIGCGWGGFAEFAAKNFGVRVTGLTISDEQLSYAQSRMRKAGLSDQVDIRRLDYRDVEGTFDKVASIEMFEAVGEPYWATFFGKLHDVLKPGGRAGLQIITIRDDLFESYRTRADFIQRYIFPGGMLISVERLREETARAGLSMQDLEPFGESYAKTLALWAERFVARWDDIKGLGFDERFKQLWRFYLSYCEAGFRTGRTNVVQAAFDRA